MKLTKKLEAEILKAYNTLWEANLKGDIKTFASYLDNNVTVYGTAPSEIFTTKKEAVKFYAETADQMTGKAEFRKRKINIKAVGDTVLINEQCDLYVLAGKTWMFYDHARITCIFELKENVWKAVHMHGSFPDSRTEQGDQIATEKIKQENIQLRDAVKRRTIELEDKNRELEIETSLEKVRAVAMGMKKAEDMLDICSIIAKELQQLGIKQIRNIQTAIINESKATYLNYEYFRLERKKIITTLEYKKHKDIAALVKKMLNDPEGHFTKTFRGSELKSWIRYQGKTGQYIDPQTKKTRSLHYYFYSIGPGALGISAYTPLTKDELGLFKRFRNVFQLAYRRFVDIEKANAQAREAQIEASLEKVRAVAMGMHKSADLLNVSEVMYKEFLLLGFDEMRNAMVNIHNDADKSFINYDYSDELGSSTNHLTYSIHPLVEKQVKITRSAKDAFSETHYTGKDLVTWKKFRKRIGEKDDPRMKGNKGLFYYLYSTGIGSIGISTFGPINEEKKTLLKRFRNVFALSYQRYMDIAKAERQAREAQIELGLERVRARAMAMQNSGELAELVSVVFKELTHLDFALTSCIIWISDKETLANTLWVTSAEMNKPAEPVRLIPFQHSFFHSIIHAWKEKDPKWIYILTGKEKKTFEKAFFANEPNMPVALKKALSVPKQVIFSASFNNFGALEILGTEPLTDEKFEILHRFGKVFDSSYTRFNDLKKAEAQAKEAHVQLALERVRARSLAMHHTSELQDVVNIVAQQLHSMHIDINGGVFITINDEVNDDISLWASGGMADYVQKAIVPFFNEPVYTSLRDAIKRRNNFFTETHTYEEKVRLFKHLFKFPPWSTLSKQRKQELLSRKGGYTRSVIVSKHTSISITNHNGKVFSEQDNDILKRFGNVFEQSYIRFLDLKKAEAQAREAQIETAMEKVRSRSLAMQRPEELIEVAELLRKEMGQLGMEELETSSIYIVNEENKKAECWYAIKDVRKKNTKLVSDEMTLVLSDTWVGKEMWKFYRSADEQVSILMKGERRREWINYCAEHSKVLQGYYGKEIPERTYHLVKFNGGYMGAASPGEISKESWDLLKRAATVFSLAYTRFKDLQDAATRAREAQIELALERVRARTIGMQKSEELKEVIQIVYEQFVYLDIHTEHAGFIMDYKTRDDYYTWIADKFGSPSQITLPYFDCTYYNRFNQAKEKGENFFATTLNRQEKNKFYKELFKHIPGFPEESKKIIYSHPGFTIS